MKSESMSSYRAALSGTGDDMGGEPEKPRDQLANSVNAMIDHITSQLHTLQQALEMANLNDEAEKVGSADAALDEARL